MNQLLAKIVGSFTNTIRFGGYTNSNMKHIQERFVPINTINALVTSYSPLADADTYHH